MNTQIITAIIGAIATVSSAFITRFVLRKYFPERSVLATKVVKREEVKQEYKHLEGPWHKYHLTRDTRISALPFWAHYEEELHIREGRFVEGSSINKEHPAGLQYDIRGEIRYGKMLLTYHCVQEPTDVGTTIYPNLLNKELLVGTWTGFDYQGNFAGSTVILSRRECDESAQELNKILRNSRGRNFIQGDDHPLQPPKIKQTR